MSNKKYISKINKGSQDLYIKDSEAREGKRDLCIEYALFTSNIPPTEEELIQVRGSSYAKRREGYFFDESGNPDTAVSIYILVEQLVNPYSSTYLIPNIFMSGIRIPIASYMDIVVSGTTYRCYKSVNTYYLPENAVPLNVTF